MSEEICWIGSAALVVWWCSWVFAGICWLVTLMRMFGGDWVTSVYAYCAFGWWLHVELELETLRLLQFPDQTFNAHRPQDLLRVAGRGWEFVRTGWKMLPSDVGGYCGHVEFVFGDSAFECSLFGSVPGIFRVRWWFSPETGGWRCSVDLFLCSVSVRPS